MRRYATLLFIIIAVTACSTTPPYNGPRASITGQSSVVDATTMQSFDIIEILRENLLPASCGSNSVARGAGVSAQCVGAGIAARPMVVKIRGTHVSDTPALAAARRAKGNFLSVEGQVEFNPAPGGTYEVNGDLRKGRSSVWIEDVMTRKPVTKVLVQE